MLDKRDRFCNLLHNYTSDVSCLLQFTIAQLHFQCLVHITIYDAFEDSGLSAVSKETSESSKNRTLNFTFSASNFGFSRYRNCQIQITLAELRKAKTRTLKKLKNHSLSINKKLTPEIKNRIEYPNKNDSILVYQEKTKSTI
ncbi:hypothetical protein VNO80_28845 [Phaseolus coccineus]|uniref:Uncharacterized protein n=1 Tax=Phaseolus coccineus TaxID=3886 RepID=A0AAN9LDA3_PHACN